MKFRKQGENLAYLLSARISLEFETVAIFPFLILYGIVLDEHSYRYEGLTSANVISITKIQPLNHTIWW